jgi:dynein heavy chain
LKDELMQLQSKIDRGDKLVSGLADEKVRWEISLVNLDADYIHTIGDCALSAAFMSYCAPFPAEYRNDLFSSWLDRLNEDELPYNKDFDLTEFLAGKAAPRMWQSFGLPTDDFSTENGVLVTKGLRWALNIDP